MRSEATRGLRDLLDSIRVAHGNVVSTIGLKSYLRGREAARVCAVKFSRCASRIVRLFRTCDLFQLAGQQEMVRRWLKSPPRLRY